MTMKTDLAEELIILIELMQADYDSICAGKLPDEEFLSLVPMWIEDLKLIKEGIRVYTQPKPTM